MDMDMAMADRMMTCQPEDLKCHAQDKPEGPRAKAKPEPRREPESEVPRTAALPEQPVFLNNPEVRPRAAQHANNQLHGSLGPPTGATGTLTLGVHRPVLRLAQPQPRLTKTPLGIK